MPDDISILQFFNLIVDGASLIANIDECGVEQSIIDIENYCDKNDCSPQTLFNNMINKAFQFVDKFNSMFAAYTNFPGDTEEELYEQTETVGKALGTIIRLILGYDYL